MENNLFAWACDEIKAAEIELGHKLGWRFLTTPAKTFSSNAKIAFITLNPGGDVIPLDHGKESSEVGSAYLYENWNPDTLQKQVRALFREIALMINVQDYTNLMNNSLMAYYIPFRSPDYKRLQKKVESRKFAFRLWSDILRNILPELIITIDRNTFNDIHKIVGNIGFEKINEQEIPTGWGKYTVNINCYALRGRCIILARLPHLSRFKIFNRPASEKYIRPIVEEMTKFIRQV